MSIPPLVCSTPPPPEQCEDDKDHEDFDLTYNLSQEEDDDSTEYNYGQFSYNIYQSTSENVDQPKWNVNENNISESKSEEQKSEDMINGVNLLTNNEIIKKDIPKYEETVVEDLNLIVDKDIAHSNDIVSTEFETEVDVDFECSDKQARIQDEGGTNISTKEKKLDITVPPFINTLSIPEKNEILDNIHNKVHLENVEISENDLHKISNINTIKDETEDITFTEQVLNTFTQNPKTVVENSMLQVRHEASENNEDDDFEDFEDFQFTSAFENSQVLSVNSENPWESDCVEGPKFGDFSVNFNNKEMETVECVDDKMSCELKKIKTTSSEEGDDDFGDFDDFRSSYNTEKVMNEVVSTPDVNLWNLSSPDNDLQIVDGINTVLTSIFSEELPEPETELVGSLESCLRETWGHMIDIEVRQPYMINWNNSLGQKTLLKALCIDSRNILFGPKWNYNMPKYAVNLTAAPLQPQKQFIQSSSNESAEKVNSKETSAWVDPFTPDGQEYTYAEALLLDLEHLMATLDQMANKHSTLKISELLSHACNAENKNVPTETAVRPTDLNVFDSDTSTKLGKIYSSTISVQPLRHINLPDTHIFTPTDSETPRSKTIHYDSGPSGLIPQSVQESEPENMPPQLDETVDKEYWDFQDFKGATVTSPISTITQTNEETIASTSTDSVTTKAGTTYQTHILQPIKIDPIMPTLNWPDPGEVKEVFDDFSDFISSTAWKNEKENEPAITLYKQKDDQNIQSPKEVVISSDSFDDEFETFQSAPPATISTGDLNTNATHGSQFSPPENVTMKTIENCDIPSIELETKNTRNLNSLSLENSSSSMSNNTPELQDFTFPMQTTSGVPNICSDILQPTSFSSNASSRQQQNKSGQILQPLSLESYSQINWPNPGIDLQDLSRFNPINSLNSLKTDTNTLGNSKNASPAHNSANVVSNQTLDDDIWGDFVSSTPKPQQPTPKKTTFADDDEWTDFVSSPSMKHQNGLNTISFNVHTNLSMQKSSSQTNFGPRTNQIPLDIPTLNYITPKSNNRGIYSEKHFQNL